MLIFVYGENDYLSQKKLVQLRDSFFDKHDASKMNFVEFNAKTATRADVGSAIKSPPFLGTKRMVVVNGLCEKYSTKPDSAPWAELFEQIPETTIVVLVDSVSVKKMARHALVKTFQDDGAYVYDFPIMGEAELVRWVGQLAQDYGATFPVALQQELVARVGTDLRQLASEVEKICAYAGDQEVTKEMLDTLVRGNAQDCMFDLMDAVSAGQLTKGLALLDQERRYGAADHQIFAMLARQVRLLLAAAAGLERTAGYNKQDFAKEMGVHPFVAQKTLSQARRFTATELRHAHTLLYRLDRLLKTSGVSAGAAVDRVVVSLA